jgi:hypothetical protein
MKNWGCGGGAITALTRVASRWSARTQILVYRGFDFTFLYFYL